MILNDSRDEQFAKAVAAGQQQTQAYEEAGFEERGRLATYRSLQLLEKPKVKARIAELRAEALAEYGLNRRKFLDYLVEVVVTPAGEVREGGPLCQSYRDNGRRQVMRMPSKLRAAEMLAKLCGWLAPEKQEHPGGVQVIARIAPEPGSEDTQHLESEQAEAHAPRKTTMLKNPRHEKFAQGVAWGKTHARACEEAGYEVKDGNGRRVAWRLLRDPAVQGRIEELQRQAEGECRLDRSQLLEFLEAVMLTPASKVHEGHRLCEGFHRSEEMQFVRMPDKLRAADLLIRIHGWYAPEKVEHSGEFERTIVIGGES